MMGSLDREDDYGLIPRASRAIFDMIENTPQEKGTEFRISCSYLEIYNETIQDLFDTTKKNLQIRESPQNGIYVGDLTEEYVGSEQEIYDLLELGTNNRVVSYTQMNAQSSRSHSVFVIKVNSTSPDGATKNGRLNLVDLAGSEKVGKTGATGQTLEEAKKINQSLSALGLCINALVEKKKHIPFRDSKLTRILQESLGGNSKTTIICACSPHSFNIEETISTLKFGQRAKSIKCAVKVNATKSAKELQMLVEKLQHQLNQLRWKNSALIEQIELLREGKPLSDDLIKKSQSTDIDQENSEVDLKSETSEDEFNETAYAELQLRIEELKAEFADERTALEEELEAALEENDILAEKLKDAEEEKLIIEEEIEALLDENEQLLSKQKDTDSKSLFDTKHILLEREELERELEDVLKEMEVIELELQEERKARQELNINLDSDEAIDELTKRVSEPVARGKVMAEIEKLRSENQVQKELISTLKDRIFMLENNLEEEKIATIDADSELSVLNNHAKREVNAVKQELLKCKDELRHSENLKALATVKQNHLKGDINSLKAKIIIAEKTETDLKNRADDLKRELAKKDEEIASLKTHLEKERLERSGKTSDLEVELESYIMQLYSSGMREVRENADSSERQKEETIKSLRLTVEKERIDARDAMEKSTRSMEEQATLVQTHKELINQHQSTIEDLSAKVDALNKDIHYQKGIIQAEKDKFAATVQDHQLETRKLEEYIIQLQLELENTTVQREEFRQQLSGEISGIAPKSNRNLANEVMELRSSLRKITHERNKLEDEANHSRKENSNYRRKLKALTDKIALQRGRIAELTTEIESLRTQQAFKQNERDDFKKKREELQSKIDELHAALEAAQRANTLRNKRTKNISVPVRSRSNSVLQKLAPYKPT